MISSEDAAGRSRLITRAEQLFASMCSLQPRSRKSSGCAEVLLFPRVNGTSPTVYEADDRRSSLVGIGACFYDGRSGISALQGLASSLDANKGNWRTSLKGIDGCFALFQIGCETDKVTLITDRLGSLHVYAIQQDGCQAVSTSALVLAALFRKRWDPIACREFLATGTVFENRSLFEGIKKLGPASVFSIGREGLSRVTQYWSLTAAMYDRAPHRGDVSGLADSLSQAVETVLRAYPRPVLDLTGGFDSRAIFGAALKSNKNWETVVVGSNADADVRTAGLVAAKFGVRHRHQTLGGDWDRRWWQRAKAALPLCDGECNVLEYACILEHHTSLARDFDVSVNGSGGEICKGYWWELLFPFTGSRGHFDERRVAAGRFAFAPLGAELLARDYGDSIVDHFAGVIRRVNADFADLPNTAKMDNVYLTLRMQRWQGRIASSTMRVWPCVSPFAMRAPMEMALSASPSQRIRHRMSRRLIEHFDPELAKLPLAQGYPALPLRPSTIVHFWPLAAELGRKVGGRLRTRILGSNRASVRTKSEVLPLIEGEEEVREMLRPKAMVTGGLYDETRLEEFLSRASAADFTESAQFARVLTLEMAGRAVGGYVR
jgi:asparagine synthetase B (glutamine-hydrolysing)